MYYKLVMFKIHFLTLLLLKWATIEYFWSVVAILAEPNPDATYLFKTQQLPRSISLITGPLPSCFSNSSNVEIIWILFLFVTAAKLLMLYIMIKNSINDTDVSHVWFQFIWFVARAKFIAYEYCNVLLTFGDLFTNCTGPASYRHSTWLQLILCNYWNVKLV